MNINSVSCGVSGGHLQVAFTKHYPKLPTKELSIQSLKAAMYQVFCWVFYRSVTNHRGKKTMANCYHQNNWMLKFLTSFMKLR